MRNFTTLLLFLFCSISWTSAQNVIVGSVAPEMVFTNDDGVQIKLSDLRGKMVLIDFWASWCKPCRKESPVLVSAYNKYKDARFHNGHGFEIFSVSLDANRDAWKNAIETDSLSWSNHISDLQAWRSEYAKLYGVRSIPASFLIDGDGVVVAINLRGAKLESALKKFKKKSLFGGGDD